MMKEMNVVVVDDEALARTRMTTLLSSERDVAVVAECDSGESAVQAIERLRPDAVFLDVQMPELSGFDVVRKLRSDPLPDIIFVTAFDQYAVRAFEVNAVDFLLKPVTRERFSQAMEKLRNRRSPGDRARISELLRRLVAEQPSQHLLVRRDEQMYMLQLAEVDWIEACGNYVKLHRKQTVYYHRMAISALEERLDKRVFCRISRSAIVNIDRIESLVSRSHGDLALRLVTGTQLKLNRKYRDRFESLSIR